MKPTESDIDDPTAPRLLLRRQGAEERVSLWNYLTPGEADRARQDANAWIKALRHARVDGTSFRDRFTYRGDSLWWFAEIYLHKTQAIDSAFAVLAAFDSLAADERPQSLEWLSGPPVVRLALRQAAAARAMPLLADASDESSSWRASLLASLRAHYFATGSRLSRRLISRSAPPASKATVAAFVHTAFLHAGGDDVYVGAVLKTLAERLPSGLHAVGVGPATAFRARDWKRRLAELQQRLPASATFTPIERYANGSVIEPSLAIWRDRRHVREALIGSDDIRAASVVRGCDLWPIVERELAGIADLQFPWSAQAMDEAGGALDAIEPDAVVTYAEAGGWGRAISLEARRRKIPFIGLQHGFIYRDWLNYRHEADEMLPSRANPADRGFPRPTITLLHDGFAANHLQAVGRFPADSLKITGSPRLDAIVHSAATLTPVELERVRTSVGASDGQQLVIVASKFSQIGSSFSSLVDQIRLMPDVHLVVKTHPAETPDPYVRLAGDARNVRVAPSTADLGKLIAASRLLITVNSTAAIEAMALGVPALALSLPNNLSPFVDAGVMAGASHQDEVGPAIRSLLYDENRRAHLARLRQEFLTAHHIVADGHAAERAADAILSVAKGSQPPCEH